MRKTIACLAALSLFVMVTPAALAGHIDYQGALACGGYSYNGSSGEDETGVETDAHPTVEGIVFDQHVHYAHHVYLAEPAEIMGAGQALADDIEDGDAEADNDGAVWDVGPDPIDGNGYVHVTVFNERFGVQLDGGSDTINPDWSTSCN